MSYGFKCFNANGNLQLSSDIGGLSGLKVRWAQTSNTFSGVLPVFDKSKDYIFVRGYGGSGTASGVVLDFTNRNFLVAGAPGNTVTVTVDFIVAQKMDDAGTASPEGYGLKVFNSDGDIQFNSDTLDGDGGIGIIDIGPAGVYAGQRQYSGPQGYITTDTDLYIDMTWSVHTYTGQGFLGAEFANNFTRDGVSNTGAYYLSDAQNNLFGYTDEELINGTPIMVVSAGGSV